MGCAVVFGEDAGVVVGAEEEDGVDAEEGHIWRHAGGGGSVGPDELFLLGSWIIVVRY